MAQQALGAVYDSYRACRYLVPLLASSATSPVVLGPYAGMQMMLVGYNDDVCIEIFG